MKFYIVTYALSKTSRHAFYGNVRKVSISAVVYAPSSKAAIAFFKQQLHPFRLIDVTATANAVIDLSQRCSVFNNTKIFTTVENILKA